MRRRINIAIIQPRLCANCVERGKKRMERMRRLSVVKLGRVSLRRRHGDSARVDCGEPRARGRVQGTGVERGQRRNLRVTGHAVVAAGGVRRAGADRVETVVVGQLGRGGAGRRLSGRLRQWLLLQDSACCGTYGAINAA